MRRVLREAAVRVLQLTAKDFLNMGFLSPRLVQVQCGKACWQPAGTGCFSVSRVGVMLALSTIHDHFVYSLPSCVLFCLSGL